MRTPFSQTPSGNAIETYAVAYVILVQFAIFCSFLFANYMTNTFF
jgi:hypothetical protein